MVGELHDVEALSGFHDEFDRVTLDARGGANGILEHVGAIGSCIQRTAAITPGLSFSSM
jgi:hypothetical protein